MSYLLVIEKDDNFHVRLGIGVKFNVGGWGRSVRFEIERVTFGYARWDRVDRGKLCLIKYGKCVYVC